MLLLMKITHYWARDSWLYGQSSGLGYLKGQILMKERLVVESGKLQMLSRFSSSVQSLFLFCLAYCTNLLERTWEISADSSVRGASIFHQQRFFQGWNCTAKIGQSRDYKVDTQESPPGESVVEVTFQKSIRNLLSRQLDSLRPTQWLKQSIPGLLVSLFCRLELRSPQSREISSSLSTLITRSAPLMG